jgi:putative endonuclease
MKQGYVYMMTNVNNTTVYIGVTSNLLRRIYEHKHKEYEGFTKNYNLDKLVYYETTNSIEDAITREKQLKGWTRARKNELIQSINPTWQDLAKDWYEG